MSVFDRNPLEPDVIVRVGSSHARFSSMYDAIDGAKAMLGGYIQTAEDLNKTNYATFYQELEGTGGKCWEDILDVVLTLDSSRYKFKQFRITRTALLALEKGDDIFITGHYKDAICEMQRQLEEDEKESGVIIGYGK